MQNIIKKSNWHKTNPDLACVARQFLGWACKAIKAREGRETLRRLGEGARKFLFFSWSFVCYCGFAAQYCVQQNRHAKQANPDLAVYKNGSLD